jgi:hypothetical protein
MFQNHLPSSIYFKNIQKQMIIKNRFKFFVTYIDKPDEDPTLLFYAFTN